MAFRRSFGIFFLQVSQRPKLPSLMRSNASWISWSSSLSFSMRPSVMSCSKLSVPRSARCMGRVDRSPAASVPFLQPSSSSVLTSPWRTRLRWSRSVLNSASSLLLMPPLTGTGTGAGSGEGFAAFAGLLFCGFELTFAQNRLDLGDLHPVLPERRGVLDHVGHLAEAEAEQALDERVEL